MTATIAVNYKTCTITDCHKPYKAKGYCLGHYRNFRANGNPLIGNPVDTTPATLCAVTTCTHPAWEGGAYCQAHYGRLREFGDLREDEPIRDRFSVDTPGCHGARNQGCSMPACYQPTADRSLCAGHLAKMTGGLVFAGEW